jgi:hypothetical protein
VQLRLKPKLQYVFRLAGKHDVLLRKFQNFEEFLKEHFDNAIKHDALLRKVLRMTQVEKNRKKFEIRLDNAKKCDILSDHAKQSMLIIQKEKNKFCGLTQMRFRWNPLNG